MSDEELRQRLVALFQEAGQSHHQAFIETDGADPEWPLWYAAFLRPHLKDILGVDCTQSQLVYLILYAEHERQQEDAEAMWPSYYGSFFLERYRAMIEAMPEQPRRHP